MTPENKKTESLGCAGPGHFSGWHPLDSESLARFLAPGPTAIQVRVAAGLVEYPRGKSAMVYFCFAATDPKRVLEERFADELEQPGARGWGPLWFRVLKGDHARAELEDRWDAFIERFGRAPLWHDVEPTTQAEER